METEIKKISRWGSLIRFAAGAIVFWLIQFAFQYFWLSEGEGVAIALVRSFAFAGTTLVGVALFSSVVFRFVPRTAQYWRFRRHAGVSGFIFVLLHALLVLYSYFNFDFGLIFSSWNPLVNPIIFGVIALVILAAMAATSTDGMMQRLTPRRWKFLHRFVYVAYLSAVFHFLSMNPPALNNPPGYLLLGITAAVIAGHIYLFFRTVSKKHFRSPGTLVGFVIIIGGLAIGYYVYQAYWANLF